ncbi:MAG TPA: hypothetical protein VK582_19405 [Pyrinomonadaceae bacterium]|nr:hypothetical protein [Pyrinomonadaceae bacterium]
MATTRNKQAPPPNEKIIIERVQTGVRLEKRLLKVLKGLAEYHDMTLGDLLEGIVLHAFDGRHPFGNETRQRIADLKRIYKLDLDADASHRLLEAKDRQTKTISKKTRKSGKGK